MNHDAKVAAFAALIKLLTVIGEDPNHVSSITFNAIDELTITHVPRSDKPKSVTYDLYIPVSERRAIIDASRKEVAA